MMKIALLVCSVAFAAAEAEADALYGAYGYGDHLGYAGIGYGHGIGHVGYAAPVHHAVSYAAPVHHAVGYGVSNVANTVGIHGAAPAAIPAVHGAYAGAGRYVANSAGIVHVAKREAEAEADALYGSYGVGHLGYSSLGYGVGHVGYAAPVHHAVSYAAPVHHAVGYGVSNVANTVGIHGVAPAAIPAVHGAYAGAGRYVANSAGVVHVAKREAEAEPEADALYGAYGYGGYGLGRRTYSLGYRGLGYNRGYSTLGYGRGLGYTRYAYGKRSADAEPEADALYGAYGYGGYGLGRRTYALGYGGYNRGYSTLGYGRGLGYGYGLGYASYGYGKRSADPATAEATLTTVKLNPGHAVFYSVSH